MCLRQREEVKIDQCEAYKIFRIKNNSLYSVFIYSTLPYELNKKIQVDNPNNTFFALEKYKDALNIVLDYSHTYNMIILPVTLYSVCYKGFLYLNNTDSQSLDHYCPSFESKEIIVHNSKENRDRFYKDILQKKILTHNTTLVECIRHFISM